MTRLQKDFEEISSANLVPLEIVDEETLKINKNDIGEEDFISLEKVLSDYNKLRNVILDNVDDCKRISTEISGVMQIDGFDPEMVKAYTDLVKTANQSLSILTDSYKKISDILLNLKKINKVEDTSTEDYEIASTIEIIKKLKDTKHD